MGLIGTGLVGPNERLVDIIIIFLGIIKLTKKRESKNKPLLQSITKEDCSGKNKSQGIHLQRGLIKQLN